MRRIKNICLICLRIYTQDILKYIYIYICLYTFIFYLMLYLELFSHRYLDEYKRVLELPETQTIMERFGELKSNLTKLTGRNIETFLDLYFLYHTLTAEQHLELTLPKWVHNYFPNGSLFNATVAAYNVASSTPLLKRLHAGKYSGNLVMKISIFLLQRKFAFSLGPIIRTILNNIMAAQDHIAPTKIYLYSGHETNVAALLHAFNVYEPHVPEYSSAIIIELLQKNKQYYVKVSF